MFGFRRVPIAAKSPRFPHATVSEPRADLKRILKNSSSSSEPIRHNAPREWWSKDTRIAKTAEELELTITEAVKAAPGCEAFVGVIIQGMTPKSRLDANWELRGIRFGGMDRQIAREALIPILERMQREFRLAKGPI